MLKARLDMTRNVSLPGVKGSWLIKAQDTVEADGEVFVRLNKGNSSLSSMLGNVHGYCSLSRSEGLKVILKLRNQESERSEGCTLFDEQQPNKKRLSRSAASQERREHSKTVHISIDEENPEAKVLMLKAVHPTDCAWILYEEESVNAVLNFVLKKGFSGNKRLRNPDKLPVGISRLSTSGGFIVKYTTDGIVKRKKLNDLETALVFHADPEAYIAQEQLDEDELAEPEDPEAPEEPEEAEQHEL